MLQRRAATTDYPPPFYTLHKIKNTYMKTTIVLLAAIFFGAGCHKNDNPVTPAPLIPGSYVETDLVTDAATAGNTKIDPQLLNPWGIAVNPAGAVWISANHAGASTVYDSTGKPLIAPVAIPSQGVHFGGSPTGVVFNATADFVIPANQKIAKFILVNEDGTVSAWGGGDSTITVVDRSS